MQKSYWAKALWVARLLIRLCTYGPQLMKEAKEAYAAAYAELDYLQYELKQRTLDVTAFRRRLTTLVDELDDIFVPLGRILEDE